MIDNAIKNAIPEAKRLMANGMSLEQVVYELTGHGPGTLTHTLVYYDLEEALRGDVTS